jgi:stearoyl-CoA desaturase (delta-9 desaturase)
MNNEAARGARGRPEGGVTACDHGSSHGSVVLLRVINLLAVVIPILGLAAGIGLLWGVAFDWVYLAIMGGMYLISAVGITVGYHRLFTHRSFKCPKAVEAMFAALGSMAVEGPVLQWVATHRKHHQHSDREEDPHSPHTHGEGVVGTLRGMFHAHVGWIIACKSFRSVRDGFSTVPRGMSRYVKDFENDRLCRFMSKTFPLWVVVGLLLPAVLGGVLTMTWTGVLLGFIWGGLVRVFLLHHVTWSINSVCHIWGTQPFDSHDESRNNAIFGVLALGEGWHNNHHAFPASARHGLRWWEFDLSYLLILAMSKVGLASHVRVPPRARIESKRVRRER